MSYEIGCYKRLDQKLVEIGGPTKWICNRGHNKNWLHQISGYIKFPFLIHHCWLYTATFSWKPVVTISKALCSRSMALSKTRLYQNPMVYCKFPYKIAIWGISFVFRHTCRFAIPSCWSSELQTSQGARQQSMRLSTENISNSTWVIHIDIYTYRSIMYNV